MNELQATCDMCEKHVNRGKILCASCHEMIKHLVNELRDPSNDLWIELMAAKPDEVRERMEWAAKEAMKRAGVSDELL